MTLRVWDLESRTCKATLAGHSSVVECIAVSPDARICVSGSDDETLRKWDITTGEQLACFRRDSEEGAQLQALADSWRFGCNLTAAAGDGAAGNDVVWVGCCNEQQSIRWRIAEAGRSSIANPAIAYLMPPICIGHGPFYNKSSHRVSFFDAVCDQLICYQLAV
ncbi:hypothetical protein DUNSADRAFT_3474 [Dunaliella salina]|uniref:Uncharacterized protein n=1 Tax=Dunaliella salina TaxID=3046 RepID=A0ABZ3L9E2_DUNSA|nr:hypothetical protein DUNSADRAFT_3474 [Dunaliella salina]|eukprot:KAF5838040.1 hypothetical protein DUNSADRAFT_3474 [Dunaliella salina]